MSKEIANMLINFDNNLEIKNQIMNNNYPNLILITPSGSGSIKKEQIGILINEFSKSSFLNTKRVYIINGIDKVSQEGANALLKFFEEPTSFNTVGILLTTNPEKVLSTIKSRSILLSNHQNIELNGSKDEIFDLIKSSILNDENGDIKEIIIIFDTIINNIINRQSIFSLLINNGLFYERTNFNILLEALLLWFHLITVNEEKDFYKSEIKTAKKLYKNESINRIISKVTELMKMNNYNINISLALASLAILIEEQYESSNN